MPEPTAWCHSNRCLELARGLIVPMHVSRRPQGIERRCPLPTALDPPASARDGVRFADFWSRELSGSGSYGGGCVAGNGLVVSAYRCVDVTDRNRKNVPRSTLCPLVTRRVRYHNALPRRELLKLHVTRA